LAADKGLSLPLVYNCSGYESLDILKAITGVFDIYMPDLKYHNSDISKEYSKASDYFEVCAKAIREMQSQVGDLVIEKGLAEKRNDITPEVISAAYARISRDPRSIPEIRKDARDEVERSRKSNSTIIFKMGHHSVAEHAVFNLDLLGISRLGMEEVEKFRLCSYTEKSQRYITLDKDYIIPEEIRGTELEKIFSQTIDFQNKAYFRLYDKLKEYVFESNPQLAANPKKHNLLEGWAKEDARYITSLATESQVGLTINARNLELMLRRFASGALTETKRLGEEIYRLVHEIAPSIIIFNQENDRDLMTYPDLYDLSKTLFTSESIDQHQALEVDLVESTPDADSIIAASILNTTSNKSYRQCMELVNKLSDQQILNIFKTSWRNMQLYDSMLREFEYVNLTYNLSLSSACFGQLKRHRMSTITNQSYNPDLGNTIPESIKAIGMIDLFQETIAKTNQAFSKIQEKFPVSAPYVLTNSHRKQVLMRLNVRELYHLSRLREDSHAQWDIQNISREMVSLAKGKMPLCLKFIGAKDKFSEIYKQLFNQPPKVKEVNLPGTRKISP